jgi:hypothetical protein
MGHQFQPARCKTQQLKAIGKLLGERWNVRLEIRDTHRVVSLTVRISTLERDKRQHLIIRVLAYDVRLYYYVQINFCTVDTYKTCLVDIGKN